RARFGPCRAVPGFAAPWRDRRSRPCGSPAYRVGYRCAQWRGAVEAEPRESAQLLADGVVDRIVDVEPLDADAEMAGIGPGSGKNFRATSFGSMSSSTIATSLRRNRS